MPGTEDIPGARRRRPGLMPAAFAVVVSLLASLLALTTAGGARAAEPECAPLALAPFGDPGDAVGKASIARETAACFTVTADAPGLYLVSLDDSNNETFTNLYAADGTEVDCAGDEFATNGMCTLPSSGTYRLEVFNNGWEDADAVVTMVRLSSTEGCAEPVGTNWDQPDQVRTTVSPVEVDCQPFRGRAGERIRLTEGSRVYGEALAWITDDSGARICPHFPEDGEDSCVLPGDGPYRVLSRVSYTEKGFPAEYAVKVRRLNEPQGCTTVPVRPFGPLEKVDLTTNPCFTFAAAKAGPHTVNFVNEAGESGPSRVYDASGITVCRANSDPCRLPRAGAYTAVLDGSYPFTDETPDGLVVLDRASGAGCEPADTGGLHRGELTTAGQYDCLEPAVPQGATIAALTPLGGAGVDADAEAVDRDGVVQCNESELSGGRCALTGAAPYRLLVHADGTPATGPYALALHRTDAAGDCPVLPAGSFADGGAKATLTTGDGVFSHCLSIPADAHTKAEVFQLVATSGEVPARFSVLDSTGKQVCDRGASTNGWVVCTLTPGKAHTVLVTGRDQAATYTLTRRDVTGSAASAGCARTAAAKVGGPSVGGTYDAPGTLRCHQITTEAATDVVHVDVRDPLGTAKTAVLGGDGTAECSFRNHSCAVTGSTSHQVLVQTPPTAKAAPTYRLDALRIATAEGPAPECTRVPSVAYGYGPVTGTLDEQHTAVCAALPTAGIDVFDAEITDTTGADTTAVPALYDSDWSDGCMRYIPSGYQCSAGGSGSAAAPTVLVLGLPEKASSTAYRAKLVCKFGLCGPDRVSVASVSPDTGAAESKVTLTVTGTALGPDAEVRLARSGASLTATTQSVSADNRTLTATVDLTGATPGTYGISVLARGAEYQKGTFTVTGPELRNTAAPEVTGAVKVGAEVTASPGSWSSVPTSYTYQWKADGQAISGATAPTYTVPASLLGKRLGVTVTAVRGGWKDGTASSAATVVAEGDALRATQRPVISGTAKVGKALMVSAGAWSPAAGSFSYQWFADGRAIPGATARVLILKAAQQGKKITVRVVAHRAGHRDGAAVSGPTTAVGAFPVTNRR
ncbi:Tat pathway signal protein [Streptomyces griseicoloratus]|nr:Tat pathway signal protein [Streptomyces griseicoloratus]